MDESKKFTFKTLTRKRNQPIKKITSNHIDDNSTNCDHTLANCCSTSCQKNDSVVKIPKRNRNFVKVNTKFVISNGTRNLKIDLKKPVVSTVAVDYISGEKEVTKRNLATESLEIDTSADCDAKAIYEKHLEQAKKKVIKDGLYHGKSAYTNYMEKSDTHMGKASSIAVNYGPARASSNIRVTTRWDFHPEICKDYKETGFCGFGDSCKFIHDRSDYKSGWELEQEYKNGVPESFEDDFFEVDNENKESNKTILDPDLPIHCPICRNEFLNPVQTKCQHYFCEKCALSNYKNNQRCFECNQQTFGIFNPAKVIIENLNKLEKIRKRNYNSSEDEFYNQSISDEHDVINQIDSDFDQLSSNKEEHSDLTSDEENLDEKILIPPSNEELDSPSFSESE